MIVFFHSQSRGRTKERKRSLHTPNVLVEFHQTIWYNNWMTSGVMYAIIFKTSKVVKRRVFLCDQMNSFIFVMSHYFRIFDIIIIIIVVIHNTYIICIKMVGIGTFTNIPLITCNISTQVTVAIN